MSVIRNYFAASQCRGDWGCILVGGTQLFKRPHRIGCENKTHTNITMILYPWNNGAACYGEPTKLEVLGAAYYPGQDTGTFYVMKYYLTSFPNNHEMFRTILIALRLDMVVNLIHVAFSTNINATHAESADHKNVMERTFLLQRRQYFHRAR